MLISMCMVYFVIILFQFVYITANVININVEGMKCEVNPESFNLHDGSSVTLNIHSKYNLLEANVKYKHGNPINIFELPDTSLSIHYQEKNTKLAGDLDYRLSYRLILDKDLFGTWYFEFIVQKPKGYFSILKQNGLYLTQNSSSYVFKRVNCTTEVIRDNSTDIPDSRAPGNPVSIFTIVGPLMGVFCVVQTGIIILLYVRTRKGKKHRCLRRSQASDNTYGDGRKNITERPLPSVPNDEEPKPLSSHISNRKRLPTPSSSSLEEAIRTTKNNRNNVNTPQSSRAHRTPVHEPVSACNTPKSSRTPQVAQCTRRLNISAKQILPNPKEPKTLQQTRAVNGSRDSDSDWQYEPLKPSAVYLK